MIICNVRVKQILIILCKLFLRFFEILHATIRKPIWLKIGVKIDDILD